MIPGVKKNPTFLKFKENSGNVENEQRNARNPCPGREDVRTIRHKPKKPVEIMWDDAG